MFNFREQQEKREGSVCSIKVLAEIFDTSIISEDTIRTFGLTFKPEKKFTDIEKLKAWVDIEKTKAKPMHLMIIIAEKLKDIVIPDKNDP